VLLHTRATGIDRQAHTVAVSDLETSRQSTIGYDKLVLATGSTPVVPRWPGSDLRGISPLWSLPDANAIRGYITERKPRDIVIVGAGLIGLEMAESLTEAGCRVTILEALDRALPALLDADMAAFVENHLRDNGVTLRCGQRVTGFRGDGSGLASTVVTETGELEAGMVLLSLGVRPEVRLAREAGLAIGAEGGIAVDEYLRTNDPSVYAGGDCVEVVNRITGETMLAPMGSTANKHGRIIGTNITGGRDTFPGVLGTAILKVFDYTAGRTGLNEEQARQAGYDTLQSLIPGNEHATYYPGNREFLLKLVAEKSTGRLLGGQVVGPGEGAKRIDVLATAISLGATVEDLSGLDLAYAPPFNSAMDPVHNAANVARNKQSGMAVSLTPRQVREKIDNGEDFVLLDVRNQDEWDAVRIEAKQARLLPLPELRRRLGELSVDDEIVILCKTSIRAYQAQRILLGAGFRNVTFMDGSINGWPYEEYLARNTA